MTIQYHIILYWIAVYLHCACVRACVRVYVRLCMLRL